MAALVRHTGMHNSPALVMTGYVSTEITCVTGCQYSVCLPISALTSVPWLQFLTNIFFIPFMARRAAPAQSNSRRWPSPLPAASRAAGAVAAAVGVFSIYWALFARPGTCFAHAVERCRRQVERAFSRHACIDCAEYGGLAERWEFAVQTTKSSRIAFAFVLDLVLYRCVLAAAALFRLPNLSQASTTIPERWCMACAACSSPS